MSDVVRDADERGTPLRLERPRRAGSPAAHRRRRSSRLSVPAAGASGHSLTSETDASAGTAFGCRSASGFGNVGRQHARGESVWRVGSTGRSTGSPSAKHSGAGIGSNPPSAGSDSSARAGASSAPPTSHRGRSPPACALCQSPRRTERPSCNADGSLPGCVAPAAADGGRNSPRGDAPPNAGAVWTWPPNASGSALASAKSNCPARQSPRIGGPCAQDALALPPPFATVGCGRYNGHGSRVLSVRRRLRRNADARNRRDRRLRTQPPPNPNSLGPRRDRDRQRQRRGTTGPRRAGCSPMSTRRRRPAPRCAGLDCELPMLGRGLPTGRPHGRPSRARRDEKDYQDLGGRYLADHDKQRVTQRLLRRLHGPRRAGRSPRPPEPRRTTGSLPACVTRTDSPRATQPLDRAARRPSQGAAPALQRRRGLPRELRASGPGSTHLSVHRNRR